MSNNTNELNNNANELNTPNNNTPDLTSIEGIQQAITECKDIIMKGVLETLLATKTKEIELSNKLAAKSTSSKLDTAEKIVKSLFVALRAHVQTNAPEDLAISSFKAAIQTLNIDFTAELQGKIFATSTVHCLKSNFNKKTNNINDSYISYLETVRQARLLLPLIEQSTWDAWLKSVQEAAKRAAKKRNIVWTVPTEQTEQTETEQTETEQTETEQTETEQTETEQTETVPAKKVVITTRKQGNKRK